MNWYIGQEIVCVKTHSNKAVVRGRTYTIKSLERSPCKCPDVLIDVGLSDYGDLYQCCDCRMSFEDTSNVFWFSEYLFAPLDQDISELTEILSQPVKQGWE